MTLRENVEMIALTIFSHIRLFLAFAVSVLYAFTNGPIGLFLLEINKIAKHQACVVQDQLLL